MATGLGILLGLSSVAQAATHVPSFSEFPAGSTFQGPAGPLYSANLTFRFTSTLNNYWTFQSCSINWGFELSIRGNKWAITPF